MLLSSAYEGVPAVVVEALAARMPVVATDCGPGVRALLADGRGTIVARGDDAAFGAALAMGLDARPATSSTDPDPGTIRIAAGEARRRQAARFTIDAAADAYLDAMEAARRPADRLASFQPSSAAMPADLR